MFQEKNRKLNVNRSRAKSVFSTMSNKESCRNEEDFDNLVTKNENQSHIDEFDLIH